MSSMSALPPETRATEVGSSPNQSKSGSSTVAALILAVAGVSSAIGIVAVIVVSLMIRRFYARRKDQTLAARSSPDGASRQLEILPENKVRLSLAKIKQLTSNYKIMVDEGSLRSAYGKLSSGTEVVVKSCPRGSGQDPAEFVSEVELLMRIRHPNVVCLLGFCQEADSQLLVFERPSGGSLSHHLYGQAAPKNYLSWQNRLRILCDAARGLDYLHRGCHPGILHRDVNSKNILLDDKLSAKLAEVGLPKIRQAVGTPRMTILAISLAYVDPE